MTDRKTISIKEACKFEVSTAIFLAFGLFFTAYFTSLNICIYVLKITYFEAQNFC